MIKILLALSFCKASKAKTTFQLDIGHRLAKGSIDLGPTSSSLVP